MDYRREIDGLRALAVVPVVLYHAKVGGFSGGFIGVDIFFVISGYLITGLILAEKKAGEFSLVRFYERRIRRILPALFVVVAACVPFAWQWMLPGELQSFGLSVGAVPLSISNVLFWLETGYFDPGADLKPLLHTWSLGVEEQYYFLFPPLVLLLWRAGLKHMFWILCLAAISSMTLAQLSVHPRPSSTFFLLPTRGWELLVGSLAAVRLAAQRPFTPGRFQRETSSMLGVAMIGTAILAYDTSTPFPGLSAALPTLGTALLILFATPETTVGRILSTRVFVGIGLISYSIYLWHQPLLVFARQRVGEPTLTVIVGTCLLTLLLAWATWRWVERPFRVRNRYGRTAVFSFAVAGSIVLMGIASVLYLGKGFPDRFSFYDASAPWNQLPRADNGWCFYSVDSISSLPVGAAGYSCHLGAANSPTRALLVGDSFAGQYEPFWDRVGKESRTQLTAVTTNWCYPGNTDGFTGPISSRAFSQCQVNRNFVREHASEFDFVVLAGHWGQMLPQGRMKDTEGLVDELARKVPLIVLMPSPVVYDSNINVTFQKLRSFGEAFDPRHASRQRDRFAIAGHEELRRIAARHTNVVYLERDTLFRANGSPSELSASGRPFSLDGYHISIYGAEQAAEEFLDSVQGRQMVARLKAIRAPAHRFGR
jgi:peptidoglycan/LPS O-acetylase OafA/YrhL